MIFFKFFIQKIIKAFKVQLQQGSGPKEEIWNWQGRKGMNTYPRVQQFFLNQRDTAHTAYWQSKSYASISVQDLSFSSPLNVQGETEKCKTDILVWNNIFIQSLSNQKFPHLSGFAMRRPFFLQFVSRLTAHVVKIC